MILYRFESSGSPQMMEAERKIHQEFQNHWWKDLEKCAEAGASLLEEVVAGEGYGDGAGSHLAEMQHRLRHSEAVKIMGQKVADVLFNPNQTGARQWRGRGKTFAVRSKGREVSKTLSDKGGTVKVQVTYEVQLIQRSPDTVETVMVDGHEFSRTVPGETVRSDWFPLMHRKADASWRDDPVPVTREWSLFLFSEEVTIIE